MSLVYWHLFGVGHHAAGIRKDAQANLETSVAGKFFSTGSQLQLGFWKKGDRGEDGEGLPEYALRLPQARLRNIRIRRLWRGRCEGEENDMRTHGIRFMRGALALTLALVLAMQAFGAEKKAKYVIMLIGDGMGLPQRRAAAQFIGEELAMRKLPAQGITTTHAADRFITGSAAAATAIGAGQKTNIGVVGMDPSLRPVKSIAELAKEQGMKVGIVSSVSIDHATPAAFYAHVPNRGQYYDIDIALAKSGFDYFGGGGLKDPSNKRDNSKHFQGDALELAKKNGYVIVTDREAFRALEPGRKVIAYNDWLQDSGALPYDMDRRMGEDISLAEFTRKGIELLDNTKGFFLMVEAGKIDWACHANDAAAAIRDTLAFDNAVKAALHFYEQHPDETLVVVTGDHECGGMTLGFAGTKYDTDFTLLRSQRDSFQKFGDEVISALKESGKKSFDAIRPAITECFGLKFEGEAGDPMVLAPHEVTDIRQAFVRSMAGDLEGADDKRTYLLYGGYDPLAVTLTHILNQKAGIAWTSYKHTAVPVGTCAIGVGAEMFNGYYDNTDVGLRTMKIMGLGDQVQYADTDSEKKAFAAR